MKFLKGFKKFLKEYRIIGLSVAFVVGIAASNFIQSFVNDIVMPIVRPLISTQFSTWEEMTLALGPVNLRIGPFLSAFFSLTIILMFLYFFVDKFLHWKPKR